MKKGLRCLFAIFFVLSILSTIPAAANNGDKDKHDGYRGLGGERDWKTSYKDWKPAGGDWKSGGDNGWGSRKDKDWGSGDKDDKTGGGKDNDDNGNSGQSGGGKAPLDGGISLLLAAGIGLGVKKALHRKKSLTQNHDISE